MQFNVQHAFKFILHGLLVIVLMNDEIFGYQNCRIPELAGGKVRSRYRSRIIRFQCFYGYEILGHRYATCVQGKWDVPFPVCIRNGCAKPGELENGMQFYTNNDAAVMFICHQGYVLHGDSNMYCNGSRWNSTQPTCVKEATDTYASCDFEQDNLCGWMHDPIHDFDWSRQNRKTPSGHIGTGPSYDHTLGVDKDGYYMYIESTSRKENDTARLLSPVYPPNLSKNGCFSFYYHMYGRTTGTLRLYMRPESVDFNTLAKDTYLQRKYLMFEKSGNQGDHWYIGFFDLNEVAENFQLIIEGIRGPGYVSDIAIDDVALLQNEQCVEKMREHSDSTASPITVRDSCLNRCNTTIQGSEEECQCNIDCLDTKTCCPDYKDFCVFGTEDAETEASGTDYTSTDKTAEESSMAPMLPTSLMMTEINSSVTQLQTDTTIVTEGSDATTPSTTSTTILATISSTSTAKPTEKTTTPLKMDTVPVLSFATPSLPMINATGIINDTSDTSEKSYDTNTNAPIVPETSTPIVVKDVSTTEYIQIDPPFKKFKYTQDSHDDESIKDIPESNSTSTVVFGLLGIIVVVIMITAAKMAASKYYRKDMISGSYVFGQTFSRMRNRVRTSTNSADMKFLVQEEELEHDYVE